MDHKTARVHPSAASPTDASDPDVPGDAVSGSNQPQNDRELTRRRGTPFSRRTSTLSGLDVPPTPTLVSDVEEPDRGNAPDQTSTSGHPLPSRTSEVRLAEGLPTDFLEGENPLPSEVATSERPDVYKQITMDEQPPQSSRAPGNESDTSAISDTDDKKTEMDTAMSGDQRSDDARILLAFWLQTAQQGEVRLHKSQPTRASIRNKVEEILLETEQESKEKVYEEVKFIINHFRQRQCKNYCHEEKQMIKVVKHMGFNINSREFCDCGLAKLYHTEEARKKRVTSWTKVDNTELLYPYSFGNLDIPGHYNYLETPEGTRKYLRVDDLNTNPAHLWELLTEHWKLKPPNLVISVTGGNIDNMYENSHLQQSFEKGILKSAVTTKAWILTDGFHLGASREISDIFQEHLQRSQWAEFEDHANIPLIGFTPWGVLADRKHLNGIHVGLDEAVYLYTSIEEHSKTTIVPNALDPYHVIYLLPDDGTTGCYNGPPNIRTGLERYIRQHTSLKLVGAKDVKTPVVMLVLGGDQFTLEQVAEGIREENQFSVVIVNNSGPIASMLAEVCQKLEKDKTRNAYGWSPEEDEDLANLMSRFEAEGLLTKQRDKEHLCNIMKGRHLIEVFGIGERDTRDLDKAILEAIFGGTRDICIQLSLTLAMDRCDIAATNIFVESRKKELRGVSETLQEVLLLAMETGRKKFVQLLLDQDYGGELDFKKFLTVERLHRLHVSNLDPSHIMGKVLRSMTKRKNDGSYLLSSHQLLPQVGRIINQLLGVNYRLLYQEDEYRKVTSNEITCKLTQHPKEEPIWHLFLWAVLANQKEMAEVFLFETSCKIGGALIAYELFSEMAKQAIVLAESQLAEELMEEAEYFQTLAIEVLENLYSFDRDEAYATLTSVIPFHLSRYVTPLNIADDAEAMRFMGHACCQTLINHIWYLYMDLDTESWKLFPLFIFFPVNLAGIVFDKRNLNYGTYRGGYRKVKQNKIATLGRTRNQSESVEKDVMGSTQKLDDAMGESIGKDVEVKNKKENAAMTTWFKLKNFYLSPMNKFSFYFMTYLTFVGIFTHVVLSEIKPINSVLELSIYEWLVFVWILCIGMDETKQFLLTKSSGPLYNLEWHTLEGSWSDTWYLHERLYFVLHLYKITNWLEDNWNKTDMLMIVLYWASFICQLTIHPVDFGIVRILYGITIIFFYCRILRLGYITKKIGPRVITIYAMFQDLIRFVLILLIFIFGFGVAFQAILAPNQPASVNAFVDVLWRPYWQMFGELFVDDVTTEMGRSTAGSPQCTYNRTLALSDPLIHPYCYSWAAPVLLGIFMLITNILLLNLLIAIFSHSFSKIESESQTIWSYYLYDLVHEYYHQVWLPAPLNVFCHVFNFMIWLVKWPRKWAYKISWNRHMKRLKNSNKKDSLIAQGPETAFLESAFSKRVKENIKSDLCYRFYYIEEENREDYITHFLQPENMRNDDLEEKAYKRHLRNTHKAKEKNLRKMLGVQNEKLTQITADLQDLRELSKEPISADQLAELNNGSWMKQSKGKGDLEKMDDRMQHIEHKLDAVLRSLQGNASKSGKKKS